MSEQEDLESKARGPEFIKPALVPAMPAELEFTWNELLHMAEGMVPKASAWPMLPLLLFLRKEGLLDRVLGASSLQALRDELQKEVLKRGQEQPWHTLLELLPGEATQDAWFDLGHLVTEAEDELFGKAYPQVMDRCIAWVRAKLPNEHGDPELPTSVWEVLLGLTGVPDGGTVYQPFGSTAEVLPYLPEGTVYWYREREDRGPLAALALLRAHAYGRMDRLQAGLAADPIQEWVAPKEGGHDLLLGVLPATAPGTIKDGGWGELATEPHTAFLVRALQTVSERGRIAMVVPYSWLISTARYNHAIRNDLLGLGVLDTVVQFPAGLLGAKEEPFALLLLKARLRDGVPPSFDPERKVRMVMANRYIKERGRSSGVLDPEGLLAAIQGGRDREWVREVEVKQIMARQDRLLPSLYFEDLVVDAVDSRLYALIDRLRGQLQGTEFMVLPYLIHFALKGYLRGLEHASPKQVLTSLEERGNANGLSDHERQLLIDAKERLVRLDPSVLADCLWFLDDLNSQGLDVHDRLLVERAVALVTRLGGMQAGEHSQPEDLTRFMLELADVPAGASVYNPFGGQASFGVHLRPDAFYHGEEKNRSTAILGQLRLQLARGDSNWAFHVGDSVTNWSARSGAEHLIVANPPMGLRIKVPSKEGRPWYPSDTTAYFISRALEDVKQGGSVLAVVPGSFLFSDRPTFKEVRKRLVEQKMLESVISFPERMLPNTSIPFYVMHLVKGRDQAKPVRFVIADRFVDRLGYGNAAIRYQELVQAIRQATDPQVVRLVGLEELTRQDYDLSPKRYFIDWEDLEGVQLGDILTPVVRGRVDPKASGPVVQLSDLKEDPFDFHLDPMRIKNERRRASGQISTSCILLARRGKSLKPTYFLHKGESLAISQDISAYQVDVDRIDLQYLVLQLHGEQVRSQVEAMLVGVTMPMLRRNDLLQIRVSVPARREQQVAYVIEQKERLLKERDEELQQLRERLGVSRKHKVINSLLRHEIAMPLGNVRHYLSELKGFLVQSSKESKPLNMDCPVIPGKSDTLEQVLDRLERTTRAISEKVRRSGQENTSIRKIQLQTMNLNEFLQEYWQDHRSSKYSLEYLFDKVAIPKKKALVEAEPTLMQSLLDNLIENAERHAFSTKPLEGNRVQLLLTAEQKPKPAFVLRV
ncbi:MAG: N-6 DNA methylase, partial [Flavobacteriales bacterium]|nr:N-6 DNA methylase [Flavobacteriales bacterium]